jgi:ABC-type transport system substrate-binding protein
MPRSPSSRLNLAPNATWSDGQPFTSDDVLWSINLLKKNKQFNGSQVVQQWVDSAAAVHDCLEEELACFHTS